MLKKKIKNKMKPRDMSKVIMMKIKINMKQNNNPMVLSKIYNIKKKDMQIIKV